MILEGNYYKIDTMRTEEGAACFGLRLLPECTVYRGHFPGSPVCPGACNIELLRECFGKWMGRRYFIASIKQCRMLAVLTPDIDETLELRLTLASETAEGYTLAATLSAGGKIYLEFKGELVRELA